jgi:hypothetical protein
VAAFYLHTFLLDINISAIPRSGGGDGCINTPEGGVWKPEMRKLQKKLLSWCQGVMRVHLAKRATAGCRSTFISFLASNYNCHLSTLPS